MGEGTAKIARTGEYYKKDKKKEADVILVLQSGKKEIEDTRQMSQELKQRIFALMPEMETILQIGEKIAQEQMEEAGASKEFPKLTPYRRSRINSWVLATLTVSNAISFLEHIKRTAGLWSRLMPSR